MNHQCYIIIFSCHAKHDFLMRFLLDVVWFIWVNLISRKLMVFGNKKEIKFTKKILMITHY